jgi:hypothetical protein
MKKIKSLLDIEKDINALEEFGDYKSAKILHNKFIRVAQDDTQMMASYENYLKLIDTAIRSTNTTLLSQYHDQIDNESNLNDAQKTQLQQRINTYFYSRPKATPYTNPEEQVTQQQTNPNQQVNQQLQQQIDANQKNPQQAPTYSPDIENLIVKYSNTNAPSSFASLLNFVGVKLNISFPQVVDILASKNVAIAGKLLSTHKNKENLKQKLSSIQPSRSMNNNQLGQVVMYAMTDHNMPDGTPIKFSKYERLGLFRSTPEQEAVYLAQKIRHIQSGDAVPKSALLPRV